MSEKPSLEVDAINSLLTQISEPAISKPDARKNVISAIDSISGLALISKNRNTKITALDALGEHLGIQSDQQTVGPLYDTQFHAIQQMEGIALTTASDEVKGNAIHNLARGLNVTTIGDYRNHKEILLASASIALGASLEVKQIAVAYFKGYSEKEIVNKGYIGGNANTESQRLASELLAIVALPKSKSK